MPALHTRTDRAGVGSSPVAAGRVRDLEEHNKIIKGSEAVQLANC